MILVEEAVQGSGDNSMPPRVDELTRNIRAILRHQVSDLAVRVADEKCVTLTGRSRTYHGKQLATHAVLAALPGVPLRNEIVVAG